MLARGGDNRITLQVENEPLRPGPTGSRLEVVDYDGANKVFYRTVDLEAPEVLVQGGLDPSESDPRFHQQMVYAVSARLLEHVDQAIGRRFTFRKRLPLRLVPHAFYGANAFFAPALRSVLFGYFTADRDDPGPNLPGQTIFTCLSHDIIAHEVTHAVVHRLRELFMEPSNRDVAAFHEGFADIVAIFHHFTFPGILEQIVGQTRGDLRARNPLSDLAAQFGYATGSGRALRTAIDTPNPRAYATLDEPHDRGSLLVVAVFDGFFTVYQRRIADLVRIATRITSRGFAIGGGRTCRSARCGCRGPRTRATRRPDGSATPSRPWPRGSR